MTKSKTKIIISTYDSLTNPYYRGGGATSLHTLAVSLQKKYDVSVIAGAYPKCRNGSIGGVPYRYIGISWFGPKVSQILFHFFLLRQVLIAEYDVWLESFTPPWSTSFVPLFSKGPVIGIAHMLSATDMGRKYRLPFDRIERLGLQFYRFCIVVSPFQVNVLRAINPQIQVQLISNGVQTRKASPKHLVIKKKQLLFLGRIEVDQKGIDILLEAFAKFIRVERATLMIAGAGSSAEMRKMHRLIVKWNLQKQVKVLGYIEGQKKAKLLRESCALVMASRYETYGMSALEAFAHSTVVIAPNLEYFTWLPESASYRFEQGDPDSLAYMMKLAFKRPKARQRKERAGLIYAQSHSWRHSVKLYERMIKVAILSSRGEESLHRRRKVIQLFPSRGDTTWEYSRNLGLVLKNKVYLLLPRSKK